MLPKHSNSGRPIPGSALVALTALTTLVLLGPLGCGGGQEGPPVATLEIEPREVTVNHSTYADLDLHWQLTGELEGREGTLRVFVHLLDEEGRLTRTFDHLPPDEWAVGEEWEYSTRIYQSILAPPLPPASYTLTIGLYDEGGNRWPLDVEGEAVDNQEYAVARVEVPSEPTDLPRIGFSPSWSPTMAGTDRQVLAVRLLTGDGSLQVDELSGRRTLWMQLRVPEAVSGTSRRIYRPGSAEADNPSVRIVAPCSGFEAFVTGDGMHDVEVPVAPAPADETGAGAAGGCEVRLEPNYAMVDQGVEQQSLALQNLAWQGGAAPTSSE